MENGGLGEKGQENGPKTEKDKTERATGLGRRTREEIYIYIYIYIFIYIYIYNKI